MRRQVFAFAAVLLGVTTAGFLLLRHASRALGTPAGARQSAPLLQGEPRTMLWAWETPEDLRTIEPAHTGVAFLAREVVLGQQAVIHPRQQALLVAQGTWLMAVVRIETAPSFAPSTALREAAAAAILGALARPGVRALQVDFDATANQRDFYAAVLRDVRRSLPAQMPLSMTALVSWCGADSWLTSLPSGSLPVEEAVPMFFRMGGPAATRAARARTRTVVTAPVCAGSVGVSTDEAWPEIGSLQRVYLFRPGPWTQGEIATLNRFGYVGLHGSTP